MIGKCAYCGSYWEEDEYGCCGKCGADECVRFVGNLFGIPVHQYKDGHISYRGEIKSPEWWYEKIKLSNMYML